MKTKLLRKVRKEWEIIYNPEGIVKTDDFGNPYNILEKYKVYHIYRLHKFNYCGSKNECLDYILQEVRREHHRKIPRVKGKKNTKIWYNPPKTYVYRGY